jgi:hypothetical protein
MIYSVTIELSTDNDTEHDKVTLTDNDAVNHYKWNVSYFSHCVSLAVNS